MTARAQVRAVFVAIVSRLRKPALHAVRPVTGPSRREAEAPVSAALAVEPQSTA